MSKDHGLAGLFGGGEKKAADEDAAPKNDGGDLPPVLDDANASPFDRLAKKLALDDPFDAEPIANTPPLGEAPADPAAAEDAAASPFEAAAAKAERAAPPPAPPVAEPPAAAPPVTAPPAAAPVATAASVNGRPEPRLAPSKSREAAPLPRQNDEPAPGILCFLLTGGDDRLRRRTLEALNVAAGTGAVSLAALPRETGSMDDAISHVLGQTHCDFVAFMAPGTEPTDDWAYEVQLAFEDSPSLAAVSVRAANSDPLSPWARVSFFMDEAERQRGSSRGFDTMVFRRTALEELGDQVGFALRHGEIIPALQSQGLKIGTAPEARVKLATPKGRREVLDHVREQARMSARSKASKTNPALRILSAVALLLSFPFKLLSVRAAAKRAVGQTQFREVGSKAAMAVFADRRVRAMTMLSGGGKKH